MRSHRSCPTLPPTPLCVAQLLVPTASSKIAQVHSLGVSVTKTSHSRTVQSSAIRHHESHEICSSRCRDQLHSTKHKVKLSALAGVLLITGPKNGQASRFLEQEAVVVVINFGPSMSHSNMITNLESENLITIFITLA
jgi:hypothetical protein